MTTPGAPDPSGEGPQPTVGPTRIRDLALILLVGGVGAWILVRYNYSDVPPLPTLAGLVFYVLAVLEVAIGFVVRSRVAKSDIGVKGRALHPLTVARVLALGKASAILGSLATGIWIGVLAFLWERSDLAAATADRPAAIIGLIGGVVLLAAALWLEYCCRTPDDPTDEPTDALGADPDLA